MRRQEEVTAKSNEYARMEFLKFVVVHRKRVGDLAERCATLGSVELPPGQAVNETVARRMEYTEVLRFC